MAIQFCDLNIVICFPLRYMVCCLGIVSDIFLGMGGFLRKIVPGIHIRDALGGRKTIGFTGRLKVHDYNPPFLRVL